MPHMHTESHPSGTRESDAPRGEMDETNTLVMFSHVHTRPREDSLIHHAEVNPNAHGATTSTNTTTSTSTSTSTLTTATATTTTNHDTVTSPITDTGSTNTHANASINHTPSTATSIETSASTASTTTSSPRYIIFAQGWLYHRIGVASQRQHPWTRVWCVLSSYGWTQDAQEQSPSCTPIPIVGASCAPLPPSRHTPPTPHTFQLHATSLEHPFHLAADTSQQQQQWQHAIVMYVLEIRKARSRNRETSSLSQSSHATTTTSTRTSRSTSSATSPTSATLASTRTSRSTSSTSATSASTRTSTSTSTTTRLSTTLESSNSSTYGFAPASTSSSSAATSPSTSTRSLHGNATSTAVTSMAAAAVSLSGMAPSLLSRQLSPPHVSAATSVPSQQQHQHHTVAVPALHITTESQTTRDVSSNNSIPHETTSATTSPSSSTRASRSSAPSSPSSPSPLIAYVESAEIQLVNGKPSYVLFHLLIRVAGLAWRISKRYSEFLSLHRILKSTYPDPIWSILSFPRKQRGRSTEPDVIAHRTRAFDHYLESILKHHEISTSIHVLTFLGLAVDNQDKIKRGMNEIPADTVRDVVDVGDILLVRSPTLMGSAQRAITGSEWDHVALVIRRPILSRAKCNLCILEAVNTGVRSLPLDGCLIAWQSVGHTVAIRKLQWNPTTQQLKAMETFIEAAIGSKFGIGGLWRGKKNILDRFKDKDLDKENQQDNIQPISPTTTTSTTSPTIQATPSHSYCCSELVACCYRAAGLLSPSTSTSFLPVDFSSVRNFPFASDIHATLDREMSVRYKQLAVAGAATSTHKQDIWIKHGPKDNNISVDHDQDHDHDTRVQLYDGSFTVVDQHYIPDEDMNMIQHEWESHDDYFTYEKRSRAISTIEQQPPIQQKHQRSTSVLTPQEYELMLHHSLTPPLIPLSGMASSPTSIQPQHPPSSPSSIPTVPAMQYYSFESHDMEPSTVNPHDVVDGDQTPPRKLAIHTRTSPSHPAQDEGGLQRCKGSKTKLEALLGLSERPSPAHSISSSTPSSTNPSPSMQTRHLSNIRKSDSTTTTSSTSSTTPSPSLHPHTSPNSTSCPNSTPTSYRSLEQSRRPGTIDLTSDHSRVNVMPSVRERTLIGRR